MDTQKLCEMIEDWPEEQQGRGMFYDPETNCYCAVGWLLHKNGTPKEVIAGIWTGCFADEEPLYDLGQSALYYNAARALKETLKADRKDVVSVWVANDGEPAPGSYEVHDGKTPKQRVQSKFCGG